MFAKETHLNFSQRTRVVIAKIASFRVPKKKDCMHSNVILSSGEAGYVHTRCALV